MYPRGALSAERKYGMYLPAVEQALSRNTAGEVLFPLPGPSGITEVVKESRIGMGSKVLECAASLGHIAALAAKVVGPAGEAHLAQLDPNLLEDSAAFLERHGLAEAVRVVHATARHFPFPTDHFDAVISDRAVCCLYTKPENQQRIMNEMARVTKPGGWVVLIEATPTGTPVPEGYRIPGCIHNTTFAKEPERVVAMLRHAGLGRIGIQRIPATRMTTRQMCEAVGVPYSDEYMGFSVISARKLGVRQ